MSVLNYGKWFKRVLETTIHFGTRPDVMIEKLKELETLTGILNSTLGILYLEFYQATAFFIKINNYNKHPPITGSSSSQSFL